MYEDSDWEIPEDFLDDFIPRDEPKKSDSDSSEKANPPKRQKLNSEIEYLSPENENPDPKSVTDTILQSQNPYTLNLRDLNEKRTEDSNLENRAGNSSRDEARANLINSILKRTSIRRDSSSEENETEKKSKSSKNLTRQNLINSILKKRSKPAENPLNAENSRNAENFLKSQEPEILNVSKPSRIVSFSNKSDEKERRRNLIFDCLNKSSRSKNNSRSKNDSSSKNYSRSKDNFTSKTNGSKNNSRSRNDSKSTRKTKQVIVRKFPGPAGILPDDLDFSNFPMAYLSSFDESENERGINDSRISNFCSQNTKNLFSGGAWQSMIDDLPVDFLQGMQIAMIKRNARKGLYITERHPFIAAIVHHIESYNFVNPSLVLKDSTDEVSASFHKDIFSMYPNSIDIGTVILLRNVKIIGLKKYIIALVHPCNVVAIYNEEGRLFTTEFLEKLLKDQEGTIENQEGNSKDQRENSVELRGTSFNFDLGREERSWMKENNQDKEEEKNRGIHIDSEESMRKSPRDSTENSDFEPRKNKRKPTIFDVEIPPPSEFRRESTPTKSKETENPTQICNEEDDAFLTLLNLEEISASQGPQYIASSTLIGSQISPEKKEKTSVKNNCELRQQTPKKTSKVQSLLKQFRHKDDLTQPEENPENGDREEKKAKNKPETSNFAGLLDFEDEMDQELSQVVFDPVPDRNRIEDKIVEKKGDTNNPGTSNFPDLLGIDNDQLEEEMSQLDFDFNPKELQKKSKLSKKNQEKAENLAGNFFEDPIDAILSQMNENDFEIND